MSLRFPKDCFFASIRPGCRCWRWPAAARRLEYGPKGPVAVVMGGITGVGGGTVRDILLNQIPAVLRVDFIASSALIGATVLVIARHFRIRAEWAAVMGGAPCGVLRLLSALLHWHLP